jgi:hypothetical protein
MSIWTRSPHQQFTLKVGGSPLANKQFAGPWEAYGVIVANRTTQHLWLPDINYFVPPGIVGMTLPVPALMQATASFTPPPGITDPPPVNGQIATLDFFAEELAPQPGIAMPVLTSQGGFQQGLTTGTLLNNNDAVAIGCGGATYVALGFGTALLAGTNALAFEATLDGVNWLPAPWFGYSTLAQAPSTWQINNNLVAPGGGISLSLMAVIVATAGMAQVRVRLVGNVGQSAIPVSSSAVPGAGMPLPIGRQTMGLSVPVAIASDQVWPTLTTDVSDRVGRLLGVIASITNPVDISDRLARQLGRVSAIPLEAPGNPGIGGAVFNQAIAGSADLVLLPGVAAKYPYMLALHFSVDTVGNTNLELQDFNGASFSAFDELNTTALGKGSRLYFGYRGQTGPGNGIRLRNVSAVASGNISGAIMAITQ